MHGKIWHHDHKLRKYLSLKLNSLYLDFYLTQCINVLQIWIIFTFQHNIKIWVHYQNTLKVISVGNFDLRIFSVYGCVAWMLFLWWCFNCFACWALTIASSLIDSPVWIRIRIGPQHPLLVVQVDLIAWIMHDPSFETAKTAVSYTHLRAHETSLHLVCRLLLEKR